MRYARYGRLIAKRCPHLGKRDWFTPFATTDKLKRDRLCFVVVTVRRNIARGNASTMIKDARCAFARVQSLRLASATTEKVMLGVSPDIT